jgi:hypothetical protein
VPKRALRSDSNRGQGLRTLAGCNDSLGQGPCAKETGRSDSVSGARDWVVGQLGVAV